MKIFNKRVNFDYQISEKFEAGVSLSGGEAKAVRTGHLNLTNSFAKIIGDEAFLINANIPIQGAKDYNPTRSRKLLLHKREIYSIQTKIKAKNLTLVPISMYTSIRPGGRKGRLIKTELGLGKSKKKFEKKESLKKRAQKREIEKEFKLG